MRFSLFCALLFIHAQDFLDFVLEQLGWKSQAVRNESKGSAPDNPATLLPANSNPASLFVVSLHLSFFFGPVLTACQESPLRNISMWL